jgi:hypothetical protein
LRKGLPDASVKLGDLSGAGGTRISFRPAPFRRLGGDLLELVLWDAEVAKESEAAEPGELLHSTDRIVRGHRLAEPLDLG